jgi:hypothetical protein
MTKSLIKSSETDCPVYVCINSNLILSNLVIFNQFSKFWNPWNLGNSKSVPGAAESEIWRKIGNQ